MTTPLNIATYVYMMCLCTLDALVGIRCESPPVVSAICRNDHYKNTSQVAALDGEKYHQHMLQDYLGH